MSYERRELAKRLVNELIDTSKMDDGTYYDLVGLAEAVLHDKVMRKIEEDITQEAIKRPTLITMKQLLKGGK